MNEIKIKDSGIWVIAFALIWIGMNLSILIDILSKIATHIK